MNKRLEKYATNPEFMKLKDIAKIMTDDGDQMNHSTVRKYLLSGLTKIAQALLEHNGVEEEEAYERAVELAKSGDFQDALKDMLEDIYYHKSIEET